jgi:serine/threonine-protein kinase RsbW
MKEGFTVIEELSIPSNFESMPKVETLIDSVCFRMSVGESFGNVLIAVTEAVNNAILHGNKNNDNAQIFIKSAENQNAFCFSIEDEGIGFDHTMLPDPTAPENIEKENGRGIFLMKNLADEVEFENNGRRVVIYFAKN